ncbi:MAG: tRNA 2-thiouridine(34) synthase MnmA [Ruminococcaceae bacterium]|nr:tRNA 2-thiouridine(34) synthase MnmA [Oscillospiraceae bacterium]
MKEKVLVAISGGVDSSVAAKILIEKGYEVAAATMVLLPDDEVRVEKARSVAEKLGIDFYVFDFIKEFEEDVISYFVESYLSGETPNPCVMCNQKFKFGRFLDKAEELGYDFIATGHYAKIGKDSSGRMMLKRSDNLKKDQSYFLYGMTQHQLERTIFPLESLEKDDVRAIAVASGLSNAEQKDSQDICFVQQGKYIEFIDGYLAERGLQQKPGKFVDTEGNVIGKHNGIAGYTIGQRKGVGMSLGAGIPLYVVEKDAAKNRIIMGSDELLFKKELTIANPNFISVEMLTEPVNVTAKTRYNQKDIPASIMYDDLSKTVKVYFDNPQRAVTPGQTAVFYDGEKILGGGVIIG